MRGEKMTDIQIFKSEQGSPPLARGKVAGIITSIGSLGITPACAGKSKILEIGRHIIKDHPRLRGEKINDWIVCGVRKGSPPLARGKDN